MVLVSTFFEPEEDNVKRSKEKLRELNITTEKLYYLPDNPPVESVPQIYP